ncbi:MAG: FHA domain-containing protein [Deltaproteobacteria bacterium]|nr:FHA domain-containing protein [Deltaproteobacteria bacterium]
MIKLIIEDDEGKTTVVPLIRDEITIGRKEGNTIRLTERNVSRRHAKLVKQNGAIFIEDLESYNGIKVNGNRISGRVAVTEGDRIQIGDYVLGLKVEGTVSVEGGNGESTREVERAHATTEPIRLPGAAPGETPDVADLETAVTMREPVRRPDDVARLVCVSSNFAGLEFLLNKPVMVVGRTDENDIAVNHRSISRHHARVVEEHGRYTIVDLQSANGVRINGEEYGKVELRRGDLIDLGHVRLRFVAPGEDFVFARDATVVDISKGGRGGGGLWIGVALLAVAGVGVVLWRVLAPGGGPSAADAGHEVSARGGEAPGAQGELIPKITAALAAEAWSEALTYCGQLAPGQKAKAKTDCEKAQREHGAQRLYEDARKAVTSLEYAKALGLYNKIPSESLYHKKRGEDPEFKDARTKYLAQALPEVKELAKKGQCDAAKAKAHEIQTLVPDDAEAEANVRDCGAVATRPGTGADPGGEEPGTPGGDDGGAKVRPKRGPRPKIAVKRIPLVQPKVEPETPPQPAVDAKKTLEQARSAYVAGHHSQAIAFAKLVLKQTPTSGQALQIVGASSCYLKNAKQAKKAYDRLDAAQRNLLRSVCARNGVTLE